MIIVGAQWGDEGKGKIVDVFAAHSELVVRFQGGANAGHTLVVNGKKTILHLVPSGILHPDTICAIGPGVVVDLEGLSQEIQTLQETGFLKSPQQLLVSDSATVLLPYHKALDAARENSLDKEKIGTTLKGIGPAYEDRVSRRGLLLSDLRNFKDNPGALQAKLELLMKEKNALLAMYGLPQVKVGEVFSHIEKFFPLVQAYLSKEVSSLVHKKLRAKKMVLFEGAQGTLLDIFHGAYPYVTSSSTLAGSACTGVGFGPGAVDKVIGIMKAYNTRVGTGPFPTELKNELGEKLRSLGHEFGSTTGRPRRCGWLDLFALKYAVRVNGITSLALMKLDVLSGLDQVGVCTGYKIKGESLTEFPTSAEELDQVEPVIEWLPGWKEDLTKLNSLKDLPRSVTSYIDYVSKYAAAPVDVISVGPGREQTLWIKPLFTS